MVRRSVFLALSLVTLAFAGGACQKIESTRPFEGRGRGALRMDNAKFDDAIPAEYGDLIGVSSRPGSAGWTQAWFMKPDKTIVVVWVNSITGNVYDRVMTIPRR